MTYMVLVNQKYMVKFDHDGSKGGAEHRILDNYNGISGAQAFDEKDIATDWFVNTWLSDAEFISLNELQSKVDAYTEACSHYGDMTEELSAKENEIEYLKSQLAELEHQRYEIKQRQLSAWCKVNNTKRALNLKD